MAKPAGLQSKLKDNSKKNYRANEEWKAAKKLGRKKQRWVWEEPMAPSGHWEKA